MQAKIILILGLALLAASANAQTVPAGSGTLTGKQRIGASGCGNDSGPSSVTVNLAADGTFSANANGDTYAGTSTTMGRVTRLTLDMGSKFLLESVLEDDSSDLCGEAVDIDSQSLTLTQATLKVNKRQTAAKLQLKAAATGTSASGDGKGKFRLTAVGAWTPL
jgi:hypothetical protein